MLSIPVTDEGADGLFRLARRVAKDRGISTVDPQARRGRKTAARGFDGQPPGEHHPASKICIALTATSLLVA